MFSKSRTRERERSVDFNANVLRCLEIQLSKFDSDDSTCWFDALHLFHLLDALRNLQHMSIEIDRTSGQEMTLAILATLLEPPPVLELSPSATRVSCLANIESFSLSCIQSPLARLHPKFLDSILPLLDQLRGLKTFELMIQEPPETHWFPRLEDVLPHLPRGLEQLRLEAVFKESAPQQVGLINDCFAQLEWLLMLPLVLRSGLVDFRDTDVGVFVKFGADLSRTPVWQTLKRSSLFSHVSNLHRSAMWLDPPRQRSRLKVLSESSDFYTIPTGLEAV
jgi:hypothetical protein